MLLACAVVLWRQKALQVVYADGAPLIVELAATEQAQTKGLSGRKQLPNGHGMLFVFSEPQNACMWMKEMKFNIDVYWFSATGNAVGTHKNLKPESFPSMYCPEILASYMLEVPAGQFSKAPTRISIPVNQ